MLTALTLLILLNSSFSVSVAKNAHSETQAAAVDSGPGFFSRVISDATAKGKDTVAAAIAADGELIAELKDREIIPAEVFSASAWRGSPGEVFFRDLFLHMKADIEVAIQTDRYLLAQAIQFLLEPK